jgi:fructose-specific component phosphotransferase system IIB-like protein
MENTNKIYVDVATYMENKELKALNAELLSALKDVQLAIVTGASIRSDSDLCDRIKAVITKAGGNS